jgi:hypothetical protein
MMKRAQAAMEFLMTYGWAILVVLVVIGALAYFGVLNPQNLLPDRCEMQQGFYCKDYRLVDVTAPAGSDDLITFTFQNGRGTGMLVTDVAITGTGDLAGVSCGDLTATPAANIVLANCDGIDQLADNNLLDDDLNDQDPLVATDRCVWAGKAGLHIENGASADIEIHCPEAGVPAAGPLDGLAGSGKKKFNVRVTWYDASSTSAFSHTMNGQLLSGVETQ